MIKSKSDLKEYIIADRSRYHIRRPEILGWVLSDEQWSVVRYLKTLRYLEYYLNKKKTIIDYIPFLYFNLRHRWNCKKTKIIIPPNVVGKGLYIPHFGGGVIINAEFVGYNCIISSGCVVGNKGGQENLAIIGNNVELCIGSKVIGKVNIGDNVIVAPNSVVISDIPAKSIVSGVPAKIIKTINI